MSTPTPTSTPITPAPSPAADPPLGLTFPAGFRWGAATSAYQVEGAADVDGRGPSVWDTFSHERGRISDGSTGDVAADQYHRYAEDVALMRTIGLRSYRFSISWSRVLPAGTGQVNQKGLDYYRRLVDELTAAGIQPMPTLWHWDTPQPLQDKGGWENRDTAEAFADYAAVIYQALGDDVSTYFTLNEPKTVVQMGYVVGAHAPGRTDLSAASVALHHLLLGHGLAVQALRASGGKARIGPALNLAPAYPADDSAEAEGAALVQDSWENGCYLDPIFRGRYPENYAEVVDARAIERVLQPADLTTISTPIDLLAVNYYNPVFVDGRRQAVHLHEIAAPTFWLEIYPEGLHDILVRVHSDYGKPSMIITENGRPTQTERGADGTFADDDRIEFCRDHLAQLHRAIAAGARVEGYQLWSFIDNFEWAEGYEQRWGLVHVDYRTQQRTPKKSAAWYAGVIGRNGI
jgi:beta-glucosidase